MTEKGLTHIKNSPPSLLPPLPLLPPPPLPPPPPPLPPPPPFLSHDPSFLPYDPSFLTYDPSFLPYDPSLLPSCLPSVRPTVRPFLRTTLPSFFQRRITTRWLFTTMKEARAQAASSLKAKWRRERKGGALTLGEKQNAAGILTLNIVRLEFTNPGCTVRALGCALYSVRW